MNWQEACSDPRLNDLPYKIELNERGQILMSRVRIYRSAFQGKSIKHLNQLIAEGEAFPEFAIATKKGTKVADVAWCSDALWRQIKHEAESSVAPEICVEVLSSTNTEEEMAEKRRLYFAHSAEEVWVCSKDGAMRFFAPESEIKKSLRVSEFPKHIFL